MSLARTSFGCAVDNYGDRIFAVGGIVGKMKGTDEGEYYNVNDDTWTKLPNLSEPRFTHSLCIFND